MKLCLLALCVCLSSGCTMVFHCETKPDGTKVRDSLISVGAQRSIKALEYGRFKVEEYRSDESKGLEAAAEGVVKGVIKSAKPIP